MIQCLELIAHDELGEDIETSCVAMAILDW